MAEVLVWHLGVGCLELGKDGRGAVWRGSVYVLSWTREVKSGSGARGRLRLQGIFVVNGLT